jgi:type II secretory ATPase GspE/PulE/Tfp pilus assembly ATPase PilB-like protein
MSWGIVHAQDVDEASKVQGLNPGIETDKVNTPKAQIMSSRALQDNFDDSVGCIKISSLNQRRRTTMMNSMSLDSRVVEVINQEAVVEEEEGAAEETMTEKEEAAAGAVEEGASCRVFADLPSRAPGRPIYAT